MSECSPVVNIQFDKMGLSLISIFSQVLAMSTGQELFELPDELARLSHQQLDGPGIREKFYNAHFKSLKRILAKESPDYME